MAVSTSFGCGTMANLEGRPHPWKSQVGQDRPYRLAGSRRMSAGSRHPPIPGNLLFVADLPVSLVGDLVHLAEDRDEWAGRPLLRTSEPGMPLSPLGTDVRADFSSQGR